MDNPDGSIHVNAVDDGRSGEAGGNPVIYESKSHRGDSGNGRENSGRSISRMTVAPIKGMNAYSKRIDSHLWLEMLTRCFQQIMLGAYYPSEMLFYFHSGREGKGEK